MHQSNVASTTPRISPAAGLPGKRAFANPGLRPQRVPGWLRRLPGRDLRRGVAAVAALFALHGTGNAGTLFLSNLSGANEIPPTLATANGLGVIIVNDAGTSSTITANWHGITGITGGRIHRGAPTDNGPAIFPFAAVGNPSAPFTWNLSAVALNDMKNGGLYMDLTTAAFPDGVIRGQIFRATLSPAATNVVQNKMANLVLDVSAGFDTDLDQILIQTNLAPLATQAQALDELSARTVFAPARQEIEAMTSLTAGLFGQAEENRLNPVKETGRFHAFLGGGDEFGRRSASANQAGSTLTRPFAFAGVDGGFAGNVRAGLALGYADGRDNFDAGAGRTKTRTTAVEAFASAPLGGSGVILDVAAGYGGGRIDSVRNLATLGRVATASPDGTVWSGALKASRPLALRNTATLVPYVQVDTQEAAVDGYTETGANSVDLVIPKRTVRNSSFEGGLTLIQPIKVARGALTARLQAGWNYLFENGADTFSTRLAGSPLVFDTQTDGPGKSSAHVEASLTATMSSRVRATLGYRGLLGASGQTIQAVAARLVLSF